MWKISKSLAVYVLAAVWWSVFYPELCFSEETCAVVQTENVQEENGEEQKESVQEENGEAQKQIESAREENGEAQKQIESARDQSGEKQRKAESPRNRGEGQQGCSKEIDAADVWQASGDRIVIRSRLWEWCEENLFDSGKDSVQSAPENAARSVSAGR